jgi:hypothetical protein
MTLENFISETIKSVFKAVKDSQEFARENGGRVNPIRMQGRQIDPKDSVFIGDEENARPLTTIEFDVALTTTNQQESGVDGIKVFSLSVGGKDMSTDTNQTVSRIKFNLSVVLPHELK